MDARDLLRRYLEQRREMGETDLVLDSLSVEEALRIIGARPAAAGRAPERPSPRGSDPGATVNTDWRAALREAGVAPQGPKGPKARAAEPVEAPPPAPAPAKAGGHRFEAPADAEDGAESFGDAPEGLSVGTPRPPSDPVNALATLADIERAVAGCTRCPLYATATKPVPGEGNPNADLVCVGEAPGENEDLQGRPFVGAAGQLLTKILAAIELAREDVFICNVLKHRPPSNRNPEPPEIAACSPYLVRQIELIRPRVILAFGKFAAQTLLETDLSLGALRSKIHRYHGVPLIATYHPAALLRNPSWKRPAWQDVQLARRILDRATGTRG